MAHSEITSESQGSVALTSSDWDNSYCLLIFRLCLIQLVSRLLPTCSCQNLDLVFSLCFSQVLKEKRRPYSNVYDCLWLIESRSEPLSWHTESFSMSFSSIISRPGSPVSVHALLAPQSMSGSYCFSFPECHSPPLLYLKDSCITFKSSSNVTSAVKPSLILPRITVLLQPLLNVLLRLRSSVSIHFLQETLNVHPEKGEILLSNSMPRSQHSTL